MRWSRFCFALAGLFLAAWLVAADDPPAPAPVPAGKRQLRAAPPKTTLTAAPTVSDEEALKLAGLAADDGVRLVEYVKQRTLSDADQGKIAAIIKRFGADDFDDRIKATEEIELYGPAAVGPLKTAEHDTDPEVAYRARTVLKRMSKIPHATVAAAAVRAIVKLKPAGAATALIGFLPLADDEPTAELIRQALIDLAVTRGGTAEPALLTALTDPVPVRRAAAYLALTLGGNPNERIRIKEAYPRVKDAVLKDKDPETRFTGLWSLLTTTHEKDFLPELIALIPNLGRGHLWQLEDILLQLAGKHPPEGRFLKSPEALARARDAWLTWWKEKSTTIDFAAFEFKPRIQGMTDLVEHDTRGFGQGRIISLGPDMKERWRFTSLNSPTDVLVLGNDRVLIAEANLSLITERTTAGTILNRRNLQQPLSMTAAADGGTLVFCRNLVYEFDKDWNRTALYTRPTFDIQGGARLSNGDVLVITSTMPAQGPNAIRLDAKLKETGKTYQFGRMQSVQWMDAMADEKVLVCEFDKVAEYDLKTGKLTWKYDCVRPSSCQRLLNGNTLVSLVDSNHAVEIDPTGELVWDYQAKDGLRVSRARRR